ncbi:hypothetical protein [Arthrobacter sp. MMS24-S77]
MTGAVDETFETAEKYRLRAELQDRVKNQRHTVMVERWREPAEPSESAGPGFFISCLANAG